MGRGPICKTKDKPKTPVERCTVFQINTSLEHYNLDCFILIFIVNIIL